MYMNVSMDCLVYVHVSVYYYVSNDKWMLKISARAQNKLEELYEYNNYAIVVLVYDT